MAASSSSESESPPPVVRRSNCRQSSDELRAVLTKFSTLDHSQFQNGLQRRKRVATIWPPLPTSSSLHRFGLCGNRVCLLRLPVDHHNRIQEGHGGAQVGTNLLDGVVGLFFAEAIELLAPGL